MKFAKLLLVSAISLSSSAFAMQTLDDDSLSEATGQDGLTVTLVTPAAGLSYGMNIYDTDAFTGVTPAVAGFPNVGVISITGAKVITPGGITLVMDTASNTGGTSSLLNIDVGIAAGTVITTGDLSIAGTATVAGAAAVGVFGATVSPATILKSVDITLGATTARLQLGNGAVNLLALTTSMTGGLTIGCTAVATCDGSGTGKNPFQFNDAAAGVGGGALFVKQIKVNNTTGTVANLDIAATADITAADGLKATVGTFGTGGATIKMAGVGFGASSGVVATSTIGDISLIGLNMTGATIAIKGH